MKYIARNALPKSFLKHVHTEEWVVGYPKNLIWDWLNDPQTFIKGQPPGFKVEFLAAAGNQTNGFENGVICSHFGPFMMFAGVIAELKAPTYRDLQYYYGSYALSFWFIRPTRLQFWVQEVNEKETRVKLQVDSYVRWGFSWVWSTAQNIFWIFFPRSMTSGIQKKLKK